MSSQPIRILRGRPAVVVIAMMALEPNGVASMGRYYQDRRPDCMSVEGDIALGSMLPHDGEDIPHGDTKAFNESLGSSTRSLSDNEVLCELAGRSCFASFGSKAGRKTNKAYLGHILSIGHQSVIYHAKITFFFGGISRRVSHELIRTYVGADRTQDGVPSQESTRFTHHTGCFIEPPYIKRIKNDVQRGMEREAFRQSCEASYLDYNLFIERRFSAFRSRLDPETGKPRGKEPRGMARKRIYEAASSYLHHSCETSLVWTTNPAALFKQFMERVDVHSDLEYRRFAAYMMQAAYVRAPNLFPPVVKEKLRWCEENGVFEL